MDGQLHCLHCYGHASVILYSACAFAGQSIARNQCYQHCGFPANLGLFFCGVAVFLKACGLLLFRLVSIDICLFFGLFFCRFMFCGLFFLNICGTFAVSIFCKKYWVWFYENLLILGLFFRIYLSDFLFNFLADFSFCGIFMPTHVGLVFRLNYVFLACFCNITWRHCKERTTLWNCQLLDSLQTVWWHIFPIFWYLMWVLTPSGFPELRIAQPVFALWNCDLNCPTS